jgi:hypothetical protein
LDNNNYLVDKKGYIVGLKNKVNKFVVVVAVKLFQNQKDHRLYHQQNYLFQKERVEGYKVVVVDMKDFGDKLVN